jgi:signal transduction histidine kinase
MGQFIDDLLTLSRLEQTEETKLFRPTNIGDLVEHVVGLQQPLAISRGLFLGCEVKQDILLVHGDPRQLTRVITNLVSNAIRYTEIGEIQVTVERDDASKQILLTVADSGVGIAPEAFPHIFEPFFRSEGAQIMTDAGSGLGLSIVQRIVASHSGYIEVSSDSTQGSTFNVFLPALVIGEPPLFEGQIV